jgi:hypothetical protein
VRTWWPAWAFLEEVVFIKEIPVDKRLWLPITPADRFHSSHQFTGAKGLHHIVVATNLQPHDPIDLIAPGGKKNDRHLGKCADQAADFKAIDIRQANIEENEFRRGLPRNLNGFPAALRLLDDVPIYH